MTHEPIRLLDDATASATLRRDLAAAARHRAPYDVSAGAARFEAALSKGAGAASSSWGAGALGLGALILGGLIAGGVWLGASPGPDVAPAGGVQGDPAPIVAQEIPTPHEVAASPAAPVAARPVPEEQPVDVPEDRVDAPAVTTELPTPPRGPGKTARGKAKKAAEPTPAAPRSATGADYLREARELQAARGLLGRDPAAALVRAEAGAAEFSPGAFAQEWEGVAVLALFELDRRTEAAARATIFLDRYPRGTYAVQVREALERR